MKQLMMYRPMDGKLQETALPENCSFVCYGGTEEERLQWVDCCRNGLLDENAGEAAFTELITNVPAICEKEDVFFLLVGGSCAGTVTAYADGRQVGHVHMVSIREEYRGKGLCRLLMQKALGHLKEKKVLHAELTTDEWRENAIRTYLRAGFCPVEYDIGMQDRWENVLEAIGVESAQMLYEDGTVFREILRKSKAPKVRFGVLGAGRGKSMMDYCLKSGNSVLVAVCDMNPKRLEEARKLCGEDVIYDSSFEEFLRHDMDCVVLANYATEHAPYAIACMKAGKHVLSEVLPVQTLKEAVELIETVEATGMIYSYAENYCYMPAVKKMRSYYRGGALGSFEYGEGEYMHNCEPEWHRLTSGDPDHWRNTMSAFYYCTHSVGPILHVTGLRPVKVTGFEAPFNARMARMGAKAGPFGIEMVTLENGAIVKSLHGVGPSRSSIWFSVYGSKGRMESAREDAMHGYITTLYTNCDGREGMNKWCPGENDLSDGISKQAESFGHGSSDYYTMYHMAQKIRGNRNAEIIDVYEAIDMFLPGIFAYRSVRNGGIPMDIPDFRDPAVREAYRNDTECTDPALAGDMLIPSYSKGNPEIPQMTYDYVASIPEEVENNLFYWREHPSADRKID